MDNYGVDYGGLKPGLYVQWGTYVKAVEVARPTDALNWASLFGLQKVDDDTLSSRESWTASAISRRAEMLLGVPYVWMQGEDSEMEEPPFGISEAELFPQIDKALQIKPHGAFLHKVRMAGKGGISRLIWLDPDTITPDYETATHEEGVKRFLRTVNAKREWIDAKDMLWFRRPGMAELRCDPAPLEASRLDAEILYNVGLMMDSLYEGNALPIMLVKVPPGTDDAHVQELESGISNLFNRIRGTRQVKTKGIRQGVEIEAIQLTPNDLKIDETVERHGKAVLRVHHVPQSITDSNAANYATAVSDRIQFAETMATRMESIAAVFNSDSDIMVAGVRLEVRRDALPVMADDVLKNAQAFASLVAGGLPAEVAAEHVGIEIPEGLDIVITADMPEEMIEEVPEQDARKTAEMDRLNNFIKNGTYLKRPFTSDILTHGEIEAAIVTHDWRDYP